VGVVLLLEGASHGSCQVWRPTPSQTAGLETTWQPWWLLRLASPDNCHRPHSNRLVAALPTISSGVPSCRLTCFRSARGECRMCGVGCIL